MTDVVLSVCGGRFKIDQFDTCISCPDDPRKELRDKELEMMRDIYQYGQTAPDLPVQVSKKPTEVSVLFLDTKV